MFQRPSRKNWRWVEQLRPITENNLDLQFEYPWFGPICVVYYVGQIRRWETLNIFIKKLVLPGEGRQPAMYLKINIKNWSYIVERHIPYPCLEIIWVRWKHPMWEKSKNSV